MYVFIDLDSNHRHCDAQSDIKTTIHPRMYSPQRLSQHGQEIIHMLREMESLNINRANFILLFI